MISLIYVSHSIRQLNKEELTAILKTSRENNHELGITGLLLYKGGNFMQVLEGDELAVLDLYAKIQKDPRHTDVAIISKTYIKEREFPEWEMAFTDLDSPEIRNEPGYSDFLHDEFTASYYRNKPSRAHIMLLAFRDNLR